MAEPRYITPELTEALCTLIRKGAYPTIAAQAMGLNSRTYSRYMRDGKLGHNKKCTEFYVAVMMAKALARQVAEARVFEENPLAWLRYGPGKTTADIPGWSELKEIQADGKVKVVIEHVTKAIEDSAASTPPEADDDQGAGE